MHAKILFVLQYVSLIIIKSYYEFHLSLMGFATNGTSNFSYNKYSTKTRV
jgi:hypothetical protein